MYQSLDQTSSDINKNMENISRLQTDSSTDKAANAKWKGMLLITWVWKPFLYLKHNITFN